jgi:sulfite exporter TauE/SafE/copper chaperone CopZ/plastocyanin domain-containing protein
MQTNLKSRSFRIGGMICANCRDRIEKKLKSTVGIEDAEVNFNTGLATVTYNAPVISFDEIASIIEKLDYQVLEGGEGKSALEIAGTLVIILALYMLLRGLGVGSLTSAFPLAGTGTGYGMLFIIGLVTSVHCTAMCGGINLSQCIPSAVPAAGFTAPASEKRRRLLFPSILYNAGRVISYTAAGIIVGALGSVTSVSGRFQGTVQLAAGGFMVIMGINMLGIFPALRRFNLRMPKFFARKIGGQRIANKSPLFIGLFNGLMPCGPLQAMQLYALSTGSPVAGGLSMFLFSMGTVPLMFGIGALSSLLSGAGGGPVFRRRVMQVGAVLITVMGMTMFSYGFGLAGLDFNFVDRAMAAAVPFVAKAGWKWSGVSAPAETPFRTENGVQIVNSTLSPGRYPAITVRAGIPVKWTIDAPRGSINGCNNRMIIRKYGIEHRFTPGENVIEFVPERTGRFSYSCWMGMIRSSITVTAEGAALAETEPGTTPSPAGVTIPTDSIAVAEMMEDGAWQTLTTRLRDDGIDPAILVVRRGIPVAWTISNDSPDPGNSRLVFPACYTRVDMKQGDNIIRLLPVEDFDFSTADNVFYGYVKVVDDLSDVDIEAVKAEVSEHETLIYPDACFEAAARDGGCCMR